MASFLQQDSTRLFLKLLKHVSECFRLRSAPNRLMSLMQELVSNYVDLTTADNNDFRCFLVIYINFKSDFFLLPLGPGQHTNQQNYIN